MASKDQLSHNLGAHAAPARPRRPAMKARWGRTSPAASATLDQAIDGWLNSPAHREALLSTKFIEFGLAAATVAPERKSRYGIYWAFIAGGPFEAWR